jgi:acyl-CoA thioesterase II
VGLVLAEPFFDLRATHNPHRWHLPVTAPICVGPPDKRFMFGGVGMAAAVSAMERTCGRPVLWATAQYLSYARPPSIVDLDVWVPNVGKHTTQARVIGHVDDKEIITVSAALGERPAAITDQWVVAPKAPPPLECEQVFHWRGPEDTLTGRFERRLIEGRFAGHGELDGRGESGRLRLWIRPVEGHPIGSDILAVMADFVSNGMSNALGRLAGGNSLDNTIRFGNIVPTEWVMCDINIEMAHAGVVHGVMHLFSEDGVLMASASQSLILRYHD